MATTFSFMNWSHSCLRLVFLLSSASLGSSTCMDVDSQLCFLFFGGRAFPLAFQLPSTIACCCIAASALSLASVRSLDCSLSPHLQLPGPFARCCLAYSVLVFLFPFTLSSASNPTSLPPSWLFHLRLSSLFHTSHWFAAALFTCFLSICTLRPQSIDTISSSLLRVGFFGPFPAFFFGFLGPTSGLSSCGFFFSLTGSFVPTMVVFAFVLGSFLFSVCPLLRALTAHVRLFQHWHCGEQRQ